MTKNSIFCSAPIITILICCTYNKDDKNKFDDEHNYQRLIKVDSLPSGVELYANKFDSNYQLFKMYYDNGKVQLKSFVRNGHENGKTIEYYEDGAILSEGSYVNGKKNGEFQIFHPNHQRYGIEYYKDGQPYGEWKFFDSLGRLNKTIKYR